MHHPKIKSLFKYCPFTTRAVSTLIGGKLWYPSASTFNDPLDSNVIDFEHRFQVARKVVIKQTLRREPTLKISDNLESKLAINIRSIHDAFIARQSSIETKISEARKGMQISLQNSIHNFGILCLSETDKSILMWSHYASSHGGICLEFERSESNKLGTDARPVKYVRRRFKNDDPDLILEKYIGWKYEREWRILENKGNRLYAFPGRLLSVTCGAMMSSADKEVVSYLIRLLDNTGGERIKFKVAAMSPVSYRLSIVSCEGRHTARLR